MLRVEHLKVGTLPPLSFSVADGECMAVEGPSGSGKTRLLRAIADLDPAPGLVFVDGTERREMSGPSWRRLVRYAAAEPAWWTDTPRAGLPYEAGSQRVGRLLASVGLEAGALDRPVAQLSTGSASGSRSCAPFSTSRASFFSTSRPRPSTPRRRRSSRS